MSFKMLVWIAFGGAAGAVARYLMMSTIGHVIQSGYPYATLVVNIVGSFLLGCLIETMALTWSPGPELRSFMVVGVLGAFTTFSTFSLDALYLYERGQYTGAGLYVAGSVVLTIVGLVVGMSLFRQILS